MKKTILLSMMALVILAACSEQGQNDPASWDLHDGFGIVGGQDVGPSDPVARRVHRMEMIVQEGKDLYKSYCTTSLVHRRLLLTAAHCLPGKGERGSLTIVFTLPNKKISEVKVVDWEVHPNADLALLELATDAPPSAEVFLLPEPGRSYDPKSVEVAGYGRITGRLKEDGKERLLRKTTLQVTSYSLERREIEVDQSLGKAACNGDSGAPGWIEDAGLDILIGVAIRTIGVDKKTDPCNLNGYFLNLSVYLDWIYQTARDIQIRTSRPSNQL